MRVTHADGSQLHPLGVMPDVHAAPTARGVAEGRDEVLEAGLRVLERRLEDAQAAYSLGSEATCIAPAFATAD
jgi:C-terminal processing protease CtpA/Prc